MIKVMSFNIGGFLLQREKKYSWENRCNWNMETIKNSSPEVLCCQEVQNGNIIFYEEKLKKYGIYKGLKNFSNDTEEAMYNIILWNKNRLEKIEHGGFYLSETPHEWSKSWNSMFVRSVTWVKLRCLETGNDFLCFNTHLDHYSELARIEGSNLIVNEIYKNQKKCNLPVILTGDFNSRPWAPTEENSQMYPEPISFESLPPASKVYNIYLNNGFTDTYIENGKCNTLDMNTYHDFYKEKFPPAALRIDWILKLDKEKKFKTKSLDIILCKSSKIAPSDHYPIIANFIWK